MANTPNQRPSHLHDGKVYEHNELVIDSLSNALAECADVDGIDLHGVIQALKRDGYAIYKIQTDCKLACAIELSKHEALYTQVLSETYP